MNMRVGVCLLCLIALAYATEIADAAPVRTPTKKRSLTRTIARTRSRTPSRTRSRTPIRTRSKTPIRTRTRTPLPVPCKAGPFPLLSTLETSSFTASSEDFNGEAYRFANSRTGNWMATSSGSETHTEYIEVYLGQAYHIQRIVLNGGPFANGADASLVTVESYDSSDDGVFTTLAYRVAPGEIVLTNRVVVARYIRFTVVRSSLHAGLKGEVYAYPANLFFNGIPPVLQNRPGQFCRSTQPFPLLELLSDSAFSSDSYTNPPTAFKKSAPSFWMSADIGSQYATLSIYLNTHYVVKYVEVSGGPWTLPGNVIAGAFAYSLEYSDDGQEWYSYGGSPTLSSGYIPAGQNGLYRRFTPSTAIRVQYLRFRVKLPCDPNRPSIGCTRYPALKGEVYVLPGPL
mmetsp:Transcript_1581/g.2390  ORF Transcript_1581/g.2390 Transcript_1581/m.2390 type:complete len:400 (-) Transcript_1581:405-1604(-)